MSVKLTKNHEVGDKIKVSCSVCRRKTNHEILANANERGKSEDYGSGFVYEWDDDYQIVQCCGCDSIRFRKTHTNSEDYFQLPDGDDSICMVEEIYPISHTTRLAIKDSEFLPKALESIYNETLKALNAGMNILTGIGIRAIIETVCNEKKIDQPNLQKKIDGLVSAGVLTKDGAEILHQLRILGNDAAHEVKPHNNVQLGTAFDVVDHLLQGVYILPKHSKAKLPATKKP